ncbi:6442_t:CDS:2 [Funneliformis geosporum]|uniref:6442_t:CDS:1 n=1 Tax=Funneliformis geosporum TaxID=1117311 RepID=A0A9W4T0I7_9GLOM|nr:6442_t:CDS:2 [Funneliformis geosporum]
MELSLEKRYEIVFLREHPAGPKFSFRFIAKQVCCSKSTVIYWVKRYHENRDLSTSERLGWYYVTSAKQDDKIVKMAEKEHNITTIQIQEKMEERGVGISVETVWQFPGRKKVFRSVKYSPKVYVWGCFSASGFDKLFCFQRNINAEFMCTIYEQGLLASISKLFGEGNID